MKGHEKIINLRMQGKAPELVYLDDFESALADWEDLGTNPVVTLSNDVPEALDLRFLVGLRVSVTSRSEDRAKRLFNACKAAKAKWVGASHTEMHGERVTTGWLEIYCG